MKNPKKKRQPEPASIDAHYDEHAFRKRALYENRDRALNRVMVLYDNCGTEYSEGLEKALDVLAVAHAMVAFDFASNPFS